MPKSTSNTVIFSKEYRSLQRTIIGKKVVGGLFKLISKAPENPRLVERQSGHWFHLALIVIRIKKPLSVVSRFIDRWMD